ncbi:M23 family metallopeptidase [Stygiobacter electus]|uniref:M23 family metallopeptidase n=1 Tax=Stygiobacter electus TaxID=3032292 RepID=A0AAE3TC16_9BACT|nr:M23 family metallopeptidase [Stygiobacter electus]MDF1611430.1 M23 family metallopeptidase [Stygiobacter electus]
MKKFYYFSKSKLQFVEIRNFYKKFVFLVGFFSILVSFLILGTFTVFNEFLHPDNEIKSLKNNNKLLRSKLETIIKKYEELNQTVANLNEKSKDLRLKANLETNNDEELFGVGGNVFEPVTSLSRNEITSYVNEIDKFVESVSLKVKLTKNNYEEISNTFKQNELLYESIPAIRPSEGTIADDFGMRMHPILKILRMHNGIDIITDIGTKVFAPGGGTVTDIGWKSGYGLTLEIDHGFGYKTLYAHLDKTVVKVGQKIKRGDLIAYSGNSGRLTSGPHLHYEVHHNGVALDPINFIYDDVSLFEILNSKTK